MSKGFCRSRAIVVIAVVLGVFLLSLGSAFAQRLDAGTCTPASGTTATVFRFSIVYYGAAPSGHDVHIDTVGTSAIYSMNRVGSGPNGEGSTYVFETKLPAGAHQYRFRFQSGTVSLRKPGPTGSDWYSGPTVTASTEKYSISGAIRTDGVAVAGVEVHLTKPGMTAIMVRTNAEGRFTASGLAAGTYTVTPTKAGYRMDPLSRAVTVGASTSTCNFKAIKL